MHYSSFRPSLLSTEALDVAKHVRPSREKPMEQRLEPRPAVRLCENLSPHLYCLVFIIVFIVYFFLPRLDTKSLRRFALIGL